jgi:DNA-binding transcriptional regulator YiaG
MQSDNKKSEHAEKKAPEAEKPEVVQMSPEYIESLKERDKMQEEAFAHDMAAMRGGSGSGLW